MKKTENGITLISLSITIVVLLILAGVLVKTSIEGNPVIEEMKDIQNEYYDERTETEKNVNSMISGWENIIL